MKHLTSLLLASYASGNPIYESSQIAFETLQNVSSRLDLIGSKRLSQSLWLEDCLTDAKNIPSLKPAALHTAEAATLPTARILLSYIFASIHQCMDREQVKRGLDLLTKLATSVDNVELFASAPDNFLGTLVELLCVNTSSVEPFYNGDVRNAPGGLKGIAKMPACASSFYTDISDAEIRDMSLESIWTLCTFSQVNFIELFDCYFYLEIGLFCSFMK